MKFIVGRKVKGDKGTIFDIVSTYGNANTGAAVRWIVSTACGKLYYLNEEGIIRDSYTGNVLEAIIPKTTKLYSNLYAKNSKGMSSIPGLNSNCVIGPAVFDSTEMADRTARNSGNYSNYIGCMAFDIQAVPYHVAELQPLLPPARATGRVIRSIDLDVETSLPVPDFSIQLPSSEMEDF